MDEKPNFLEFSWIFGARIFITPINNYQYQEEYQVEDRMVLVQTPITIGIVAHVQVQNQTPITIRITSILNFSFISVDSIEPNASLTFKSIIPVENVITTSYFILVSTSLSTIGPRTCHAN